MMRRSRPLLARVVLTLRPGRRRRLVDPFSTLEVQCALGRLDAEIGRLLAGGGDAFARGHHLRAAVGAYERALADACRLAGVPGALGGGPVERLLAEAELRRRGWQW